MMAENSEAVLEVMQENIQGQQPPQNEGETEQKPGGLPPLTYIDFVPQCLGSKIEGKEPQFADFGTLMEQANQWLLSMPQFQVYKCETVRLRLGVDYNLDNDTTLVHLSSHGKNTFLRILRVWLIPKADSTLPTQQLAYITVLPDHPSGDVTSFLNSLVGSAPARSIGDVNFPEFDNQTDTIDKLNKHLQAKPLPGRILTVETITFKCQEANNSDKWNIEGTCWSETGANAKVYVHAFRIFYVVGQPAFETIGIRDEIPEMLQNNQAISSVIKFSTTGQTIASASQWLQSQQGIRVVNVQAINVKLEKKLAAGPWIVDSALPGFTENQSLTESRYLKVLRIAYVSEQKGDNPSPYASVTLTSRLFVPNRGYGKSYETFSKTMLKVIKWLNATRLPVFACETVRYHVTSVDGYGPGFNEEKTDYQINNYSGQHYITCVRLYFPCLYQEPPPEIPETEEVGWGCVLS